MAAAKARGAAPGSARGGKGGAAGAAAAAAAAAARLPPAKKQKALSATEQETLRSGAVAAYRGMKAAAAAARGRDRDGGGGGFSVGGASLDSLAQLVRRSGQERGQSTIA